MAQAVQIVVSNLHDRLKARPRPEIILGYTKPKKLISDVLTRPKPADKSKRKPTLVQ